MAKRGKSVLLVRHGATEWSENGRHTGRTDLPLVEKGRQQARELSRLLSGRSFVTVLTSPLQRARETCRIAGFEAQAEICNDLVEWDYGAYEGLTTAEIRARCPGWTIWDAAPPEGETLAQVAARAERVIARARSATGDALLFAHAHLLRVLTARWCELPAAEGRRFPLETGALCALGFERETPGLLLWNAR
jgi:probable phosphoglycerate mutase